MRSRRRGNGRTVMTDGSECYVFRQSRRSLTLSRWYSERWWP